MPVEKTHATLCPVDGNPFEAIYVDLTDRCNLSCSFCYNSSGSGRNELDPDYFAEVCRRLPRSVYFRFVGGEPALHEHFFDLVRIGKAHGHHVQFSSNGLIYNDDAFVRELRRLDGDCVAGITLDGGYSGRESYRIINGTDCLERKLAGLENLHRHGIRRVALTAIIVRGVNEQTIPELLELAGRYPEMVRFIHYRTAARLGRFRDTAPYSLEELAALVRPRFHPEQFRPACIGEIHCPPEANRGCCYRFRPSRRLQVALIEFASPRAAGCPRRGKLLADFKIVPFFEHMIATAG